jgi:hypothetical protein
MKHMFGNNLSLALFKIPKGGLFPMHRDKQDGEAVIQLKRTPGPGFVGRGVVRGAG